MPVGGFETSTLRFPVQAEQSDKDSRLERILRAERRNDPLVPKTRLIKCHLLTERVADRVLLFLFE